MGSTDPDAAECRRTATLATAVGSVTWNGNFCDRVVRSTSSLATLERSSAVRPAVKTSSRSTPWRSLPATSDYWFAGDPTAVTGAAMDTCRPT